MINQKDIDSLSIDGLVDLAEKINKRIAKEGCIRNYVDIFNKNGFIRSFVNQFTFENIKSIKVGCREIFHDILNHAQLNDEIIEYLILKKKINFSVMYVLSANDHPKTRLSMEMVERLIKDYCVGRQYSKDYIDGIREKLINKTDIGAFK
jgi:hypothetical protein